MANQIVPFGKYRGQPIDVLLADTQYMAWLSEQPWVKERYPIVQTLIINNFGEPDETPEHNGMQNKFFDDEYVHAFVFGAVIERCKNDVINTIETDIKIAKKQQLEHQQMLNMIHGCNLPDGYNVLLPGDIQLFRHAYRFSPHFEERSSYNRSEYRYDVHDLEEANKGLQECIDRLTEAVSNIKKLSFSCPETYEVEAECDGWDIWVYFATGGLDSEYTLFRKYLGDPDCLLVEIKPEIGDDFPAILRQMKANYTRWKGKNKGDHAIVFLIYKSFHSSSATEDDVKKQFGASGFLMVREDEFWPPSQDVTDNYLETISKK